MDHQDRNILTLIKRCNFHFVQSYAQILKHKLLFPLLELEAELFKKKKKNILGIRWQIAFFNNCKMIKDSDITTAPNFQN